MQVIVAVAASELTARVAAECCWPWLLGFLGEEARVEDNDVATFHGQLVSARIVATC